MTEIDVVVGIVSYRTAALTIECLRSIDAERSTPSLRIRAVVVDNASGDTPMIARAIESNSWSSWVTLLSAPRNGGFSYGNNLALRHAYEERRPDYFHLLNPDTVVRQGAIGTLANFLETHPNVGIVGGTFEDPDGSDWQKAFRFPSLLSEVEGGLQLGWATRALKRWVVTVGMSPVPQPTDWVSGASMMVRREVFEAIGGFDEKYFLYFEETDFCRRARKAGFSTWFIPESRVMHIRGQSTKVTTLNSELRRLPAYWFESRRRYFVTNHGTVYAMAVDLAALLANALGSFKRIAVGRRGQGIPHFLEDLAHHSTIWPSNRRCAAAKACTPYFQE